MEKIKKYFHLVILFLLFIFILSFSNPIHAQENTYWKDYFDRVSEDANQIRDFNDYTNQDNLDLKVTSQKIDSLVSRLTESLRVYSQPHPTLGDSQVENSVSSINSGINIYKNGLLSLKTALKNSNKNEAEKAIDTMNNGNDQITSGFKSISERYNELDQTDKNTSNSYLIGILFFGSISFFLLIKSRKKSKYPTEQIKINLFSNLFLTSLWPTGGFLITLISYKTSTSGKYTIATGAIVIGIYSLIRQLFNYFKNVKPELDRYIEAEKILIDNYDDLLSLYNRISKEDFVDAVVGKYKISRKSAELLQIRITEFINNYQESKSSSQKDPYDVLGVKRNDTLETIKQKYRELAKKYHPDIAGASTEEMFKEINLAYTTILSERRGY